jgi:hypothetical protein
MYARITEAERALFLRAHSHSKNSVLEVFCLAAQMLETPENAGVDRVRSPAHQEEKKPDAA